FPLIVKPNFEGSSKGIADGCVVEDVASLRDRVAATLEAYPAGVLVEEYIAGTDVSVAFLEKATPLTASGTGGGVLAAVEIVYADEVRARKFPVHDFALKHDEAHLTSLRCPAQLPSETLVTLAKTTRHVLRALGVSDFGIVDFRVTPEGAVYLID